MVAVAVAAALATTGCTGSGGTKAGGGGEPVTLRMANPYAHLDYEPAVAYFVRQVQERSGKLLRVEVTHEWGQLAPDAEQQVVRATADGTVDLAWTGTRVFDTLGVTSLRALTAPLLVDSYPLQQAVVDSDLPGQMLDGLEPAGVTGLAVLAGGLRRPIAVKAPLLGPADWSGRTIQTFRSAGQSATIRALGATPTDAGPQDRDEGLASGEIHGFENNLLIYGKNGLQAVAPHVAANVVLWPETTVLLVNPDRLAGLSAEQQRWLREAAADAAARSSDLVDLDGDVLTDICQGGARLATASPAQLDALRTAVRPVYTELRRDPPTAAYLERIEQLKRATSASALPIPAACTGAHPQPTATEGDGGDLTALNGVYRLEWTVKELVAAGQQQQEAAENAGILTLMFDDGRLVWNWAGAFNCVGRYRVSGARVSIISGSGPQWECGGAADWDKEHFSAAWKVSDRELVLSDIRAVGQFAGDQDYFAVLFGGKPWTRIG
ncbi:TRAP-type C4-dicarboxylate transport system, substrate-binding protein [Asanoa hainanensis]|uniref:TRAP-type C4-dicarboxylate transport system, substrate-binding protein n=2 Tax=Asanoa hainanensis TaxID=560556 RepID=A0A239P9W2_9ACTN|nr:TRAP-type C4-dicarboxylate transport system, substrate-binding protein [Asanoa hainanensis]